MDRKIITITIFIFTLLLLSIAIVFGHKLENRLSSIQISNTKWNDIISSREESEYDLIDGLKFNGYDLFKDKVNNKYYYSLVKNDRNTYNPMIRYISSINGLSIASISEITDMAVANNEELQLIIYTDTKYQIVNVVCTSLPIMSINYNAAGIDNSEAIDMKLNLFDNREDIKEKNISINGKIRYRGATSLTYPKKSYRMYMDDNISLLGMREDDDWILYSPYNDSEKIRNVFASNLWYECCSKSNEFNVNNGYEYRYIELIVNDEYYGLYALGYHVDEKQLGLLKDANGYYDEYLFKKQGWSYDETDVIKSNNIDSYELKNNVLNEKEAYEKLKQYYIDLLYRNDINLIKDQNDIKNSIDTYLFFNFVQGVDNVGNTSISNMYITFKKYNNGYKTIYTPWDLDQTFGNVWDESKKNLISQYKNTVDSNIVMEINPMYIIYNLGDTNISDMVLKRYMELRNTYWSSESLTKIINEYENQIYNSGAFLRDEIRWPDGNYNKSEEKLNRFKNYVLERLKYMDTYMEETFSK